VGEDPAREELAHDLADDRPPLPIEGREPFVVQLARSPSFAKVSH
jgi:hypothetical protein